MMERANVGAEKTIERVLAEFLDGQRGRLTL